MVATRPKILLFYAVSIIFLALNLYFVVTRDSLLLAVLPVALALVFVAFWRLDYLLFFIVFCTPLSVALKELIPGLSFDMNLPTEPLVVGVFLIFLLRLVAKPEFDKPFLKHPVSLVILFYLGWMLLTSLTSTMPTVSLKYWVSKVWFVVAFYVLGYELLKRQANIYRFILLYCAGFMVVIAYAWWRHAGYGFFDNQAANFAMNPFYKDHTSYGAMLVFFIPALVAVWLRKGMKTSYRFLTAMLLLVFFVALVFSYTRAAWLSLLVALVVLAMMLLRIKFRTVLILAGILVGVFFMLQHQIVERLEQNRQQSSEELAGHLSSISNVSTDASNVERLNRWYSAYAMFQEKPLLGWGPGTYMFQYAPFQRTDLRTIISTNSGDVGNAHSEYLGPLADSGIPGFVSILLLVLVMLRTGFRIHERSDNPEHKILALAATTALVSYFAHGVLNNFLDMDKAAIPVWFFIALLVTLDLRLSSSSSAGISN